VSTDQPYTEVDQGKHPNEDEGVGWLEEHRLSRRYNYALSNGEHGTEHLPSYSRPSFASSNELLLSDKAFNNHDVNDGSHVSPYDEGIVQVGTDALQVRLIQGVDEPQLRKTLRRAIRATNGVHPDDPDEDTDPEEMFRGGLQTALESQVVVFEVIGASRVLTHQLVRSRRAAFHQQSQRATWYGDRPNVRMPMSVFKNEHLRSTWDFALLSAWGAYKEACDAGVSYQDARYILPEGTTNYILCEYSIREFIAMFEYRGCSMFQWEMVACARSMRSALLEAHPFLEPYIKISCEKTGPLCESCGGTGIWEPTNKPLGAGTGSWVEGIEPGSACPYCLGKGGARRCTFQGWENVEQQCAFPWAKQSNRVFLPSPRNRIGRKD
jgi:thymidylate synthase ThyX